ncbi:thrombospondin type 3 repeat-containing protein [Candidatus Gracilibacteria bacterium]|nr:thrombospondin type 3 repeat-containing protein [Candidatus Gracilibacteria bacterium]
MKHILLLLTLTIFSIGNSFALIGESQYKIGDIDLSCYALSTSQIFETSTGKVYFEASDGQELLALQNNTILPLANTEGTSRYISFQAENISQDRDTNSSFSHRYNFGDLDTNISREIILSFDEYNTLSSRLNFSHSAKSYTPKYYISEDAVNYSQIFKTDINDFQIQKLKIVFEPHSQDNIREIIKIGELNIERLNTVLEVSGVDSSLPLHLYYQNTCMKTLAQIQVQSEIDDNSQILNPTSLRPNIYYTQKTSDTDSDTIQDLYDNCVNIANSDQTDINQNSIGDVCEFDRDSDGVPDEIDNCRNIANPNQEDSDRDSIGNMCDNCNLYNPSQIDQDNNGVGDTCDSASDFLTQNDDDTDGIVNSRDNCENIANPNQEDSDNDGVGNVCDNCMSYQNSNQLDVDGNGVGDICEDADDDGIESLTDNCPGIANPAQVDSDNDGVGDMCEDDDNDSIIFSNDNCPYLSNRDQRDTDGDNIGDVCDETDDRFLESNKTLFTFLMMSVILIFVGGIFCIARKIQK